MRVWHKSNLPTMATILTLGGMSVGTNRRSDPRRMRVHRAATAKDCLTVEPFGTAEGFAHQSTAMSAPPSLLLHGIAHYRISRLRKGQ